MKYKTIVSAVLAAILTTGGFAYAQGRGDRDNDRGRNEQRGDRDNRGNQGRDNRDNRRDDRRDNRHDDRRDARGAGPNHAFHRGDRMPAQYRHRQYVVNDWRSHNLSAPPRGQQWVQSGSDYVLVAVASGIIMQLLLNN